jgi:colanic acid/amylovoran biosynthesis glycosyltransferase
VTAADLHNSESCAERPTALRLCVVTSCLGGPSEIWVQRQLAGFRDFLPWVLTAETKHDSGYSLPGLRVEEVVFSADSGHGWTRWPRRLLHSVSRNFYHPTWEESRRLRATISSVGADIILCHFGPVALSILPIAASLDIPLVAHFHGYDLSSSLQDRWYRWSLVGTLRRFAAIVVVGTRQQKWMLEHGVAPEQVHVIPCGVPTDEFVPLPSRPRSRIKFLAVSRLVEGKGVDYTIRAFKAVVTAGQSVELIVIGDGPERPHLATLISDLQLEPFVTLRGALPNSEVRRQMQDADVFVQHSIEAHDGWWEGFGVSLAEASATGLPIIATRCGGILDQVLHEETGLLVQQRDTAAMADAMLTLAGDEEMRRRLGANGRQRMQREYETRLQVRKLESVLFAATRLSH